MEDDVIAEFDVCLSGALKDNLQLLQYPLRPRYRQYGDQGELQSAELGINSKYVTVPSQVDQQQMTRRIVKEAANIKMNYKLDTGINYDKNAIDHRITTQTLLSTPVDTCGTAVDSTFASIALNVQANYAIGVFKDDKFILTPLAKFQQVRPSFDHVNKEREARQIKTKDQINKEQQQAEKISRIVQGQETVSDIVDTQWVPIKIYGPQTIESEIKFKELTVVDNESLGTGLEITSQYAEILAPVYNVNDFSTEFLSRQTGSKLTGLKLAQLSTTKMIEMILKKAGIISLTRMMRILSDGCVVAHLDVPKMQDVVDFLVQRAYTLQQGNVYIARGDQMYESQRLSSIWQYLVKNLLKGALGLEQVMEDTQSDFVELRPLLDLLADRVGNQYVLKQETCSLQGFKFNQQQALKDLKDLEYDVIKAQKENFYKSTIKSQFTNTQAELRNLIKKVYVQLNVKHVQTSQELKDLLELQDLTCLDLLLQKLTLFVNDRYYLKQLETPGLTSARNKLLEVMMQSETSMTKQQLTDTVKQLLKEQGFEVTEQDIAVALKMIATGTTKAMKLK